MKVALLTAAVLGGIIAVTLSAQQGAGRGRPIDGPNAIIGRVLSPTGQPVPGMRVTAMRRTPDRTPGVRMVNARLVATTDAMGRYRLGELTFDEYLVLAIPRNAPVDDNRQINRAGYANTYHPGTRVSAEAHVVTVSATGPAAADIVMVPATLAVISGTVFGSSGTPVSGGTLQIASGDGFFGLESRSVVIRPGGQVVVPGLQPGTYYLQYRESQWPPPAQTIPLVSQATVTLDGEDRVGVRVLPVTMTPVRGRVTWSEPAGTIDHTKVRVSAGPVSFEGNPGPIQSGALRADSTFEFLAWPGPHRARLWVDGQEWTVTTIRWKGVDVTRTGIDVQQGVPVSDVEVVARPRGR